LCVAGQAITKEFIDMHELLPQSPDLRVTQKTGRVDAKTLEAVDQLVLILPKRPKPALWNAIPQGNRLKAAMGKRPSGDIPVLQTRLTNKRQTFVVVATVSADTSAFELLTISRKLVAAATAEKAGSLGILAAGFDANDPALSAPPPSPPASVCRPTRARHRAPRSRAYVSSA
jgi:hypothetical protein